MTEGLVKMTSERIEDLMRRREVEFEVGGSQLWRIDARLEAEYTPASFDVNPYGEKKVLGATSCSFGCSVGRGRCL